VVLISVLGGFLLEGGNFLVLMQWAEFVIIGGAAAGALLISTPKSTLVKMVNYVLGSVKSQNVSRESLQELLQLLYEIFQTARVKGLLTLEQHVEKPEESEIFSKYPFILKNHHTLEYLVDSLKLMVVGGVPPLELEALLESDLETQEEEGKKPAHSLARIADSLPGLGIVAAVLGIVLTMQAIGGPASEVGHKVGAAMEEIYLRSIKAGVVAYAKGMPPIVAVEFARRVIVNDFRPSFAEVEDACRAIKVKA
jgi:chemotaxis protein MotA